jgi:hypothetical protein
MLSDVYLLMPRSVGIAAATGNRDDRRRKEGR